jgi:hypothetical protein
VEEKFGGCTGYGSDYRGSGRLAFRKADAGRGFGLVGDLAVRIFEPLWVFFRLLGVSLE